MLPTDAAMEHGSNCNTIQNALQKVKVHINFDQAAIVLNELRRELPELFRLRRKEKRSPAKQTNNIQSKPCAVVCDKSVGGFCKSSAYPCKAWL